MSEIMPDPREMKRMGDLNEVKNLFHESARMAWNQSEESQVVKLYEIALKEEPDDPVGWIKEFEASHPLKLDVGVEQRRLGKILYMAELYLNRKSMREMKETRKERNF